MSIKDEQRDKILITCPNEQCQQKLAIPVISSTLLVTCPNCKATFEFPFPREKVKSERDSKKTGTRWWSRGWFVVLWLILFYPVGLILLLTGKNFTKRATITLSILFGWVFLIGIINNMYYAPYTDLVNKADEFLNSFHDDSLISEVDRYPLPEDKNFQYTLMQVGEIPFSEWVFEYPLKITGALNQKTAENIFEEMQNSVVRIITRDSSGSILGEGSGFVIHPKGLVATNYHVVKDASQVLVKLASGKLIDAVPVCKHNDLDLIVIGIKETNLPYLELGNSQIIKVMQGVIAIGNPLGYENTATSGVISGIRENEQGYKIFQTNADISYGSSGGPLLDMYGRVIGITTWKTVLESGFNFAIPAEYLEDLVFGESIANEPLLEERPLTNSIAGKDKYVSEKYRFEVTCPSKEWIIHEKDDPECIAPGELLEVELHNPDMELYIIICIEEGVEGITSRAYKNFSLAVIKKEGTELKNYEEKDVIVGGVSGVQVKYTDEFEDFHYIITSTYFVRGDKAFTVASVIWNELFPQAKDDVEKIIKSFKFLES